MDTFKKPERVVIEVMPYIEGLLKNGIIKDLQEDERICPVCQGTGLAMSDQVYGLSNDPEKTVGRFPYRKGYISNCQNCYGGVIKVCQHCGEPIGRKSYQCECDGAKAERLQKSVQTESEKFKESIKLKYDDEIALAMEMLCSDDYTYSQLLGN